MFNIFIYFNFYFILNFCRSCRIAVAIAYRTGLSAVQVHVSDSVKATKDLPERINEFLNVVVEVGGSGCKLAISVSVAGGEP